MASICFALIALLLTKCVNIIIILSSMHWCLTLPGFNYHVFPVFVFFLFFLKLKQGFSGIECVFLFHAPKILATTLSSSEFSRKIFQQVYGLLLTRDCMKS